MDSVQSVQGAGRRGKEGSWKSRRPGKTCRSAASLQRQPSWLFVPPPPTRLVFTSCAKARSQVTSTSVSPPQSSRPRRSAGANRRGGGGGGGFCAMVTELSQTFKLSPSRFPEGSLALFFFFQSSSCQPVELLVGFSLSCQYLCFCFCLFLYSSCQKHGTSGWCLGWGQTPPHAHTHTRQASSVVFSVCECSGRAAVACDEDHSAQQRPLACPTFWLRFSCALAFAVREHKEASLVSTGRGGQDMQDSLLLKVPFSRPGAPHEAPAVNKQKNSLFVCSVRLQTSSLLVLLSKPAPSTLLFSMRTLESTRGMETMPAETAEQHRQHRQQRRRRRYFSEHSHMTFTSTPARVGIHTLNLPSLILE